MPAAEVGFSGLMKILPTDSGFIALTASGLNAFDLNASTSSLTNVVVNGDPDFATSAMISWETVGAWDGEAVALVGPHVAGGLSLTRVAPSNGNVYAPPKQISPGDLTVQQVLRVPDPKNASASALAVLTTDGGNLRLMRVDLQGEVITPDAAIVAYTPPPSPAQPFSWTAPQMFWDGARFVVFWTALAKPFQQVFAATVTCP